MHQWTEKEREMGWRAKGYSLPYLETLCIAYSLLVWKDHMRGKNGRIFTDNEWAAKYALKGHAEDWRCLKLVQDLCVLMFNLETNICIEQVPREENSRSDALSQGREEKFLALMGPEVYSKVPLPSLWPV
jgi:hypothetical protein